METESLMYFLECSRKQLLPSFVYLGQASDVGFSTIVPEGVDLMVKAYEFLNLTEQHALLVIFLRFVLTANRASKKHLGTTLIKEGVFLRQFKSLKEQDFNLAPKRELNTAIVIYMLQITERCCNLHERTAVRLYEAAVSSYESKVVQENGLVAVSRHKAYKGKLQTNCDVERLLGALMTCTADDVRESCWQAMQTVTSLLTDRGSQMGGKDWTKIGFNRAVVDTLDLSVDLPTRREGMRRILILTQADQGKEKLVRWGHFAKIIQEFRRCPMLFSEQQLLHDVLTLIHMVVEDANQEYAKKQVNKVLVKNGRLSDLLLNLKQEGFGTDVSLERLPPNQMSRLERNASLAMIVVKIAAHTGSLSDEAVTCACELTLLCIDSPAVKQNGLAAVRLLLGHQAIWIQTDLLRRLSDALDRCGDPSAKDLIEELRQFEPSRTNITDDDEEDEETDRVDDATQATDGGSSDERESILACSSSMRRIPRAISTAVNKALAPPTRAAVLLELNRAAAEGNDTSLVGAALPRLMDALVDDSIFEEDSLRFLALSFCLMALGTESKALQTAPLIAALAGQLQIWKREGFAAQVPHKAAEEMLPQELRAGCALLATRFVVKCSSLQDPSAVEICEACLTCAQSPDVQAAGIQAVSGLVQRVKSPQPLAFLQRLLNALDSCYRSSTQYIIRQHAVHAYGALHQVAHK